MSVDPARAAWIWAELLLPGQWPLLAAALGTACYWRRLRSRGAFFFVAWGLGHGMQGLVSTPWPLIWMAFFDKQGGAAPSEGAVLSLHAMMGMSILLTLWGIRALATKYWRRLCP